MLKVGNSKIFKMKKMIIYIFAVAILASGCKKDELVVQSNKLEGFWQLDSYHERTTDLNGAVLTDISTAPRPGSVEFIRASDEGNDVFNIINTEGLIADAPFVSYFKQVNAGARTSTGGHSFYWDADPNGERIFLWAVAPGTSYHRVVNLNQVGKNEIEINFMIDDSAGKKRSFYTYGFRR